MKTLAKIHELRKSLHLRSFTPERAFNNRLRRPKQILKIVEDAKPSVTILYEARRQYIVSLACAFEVFWRETVRDAIDFAGIEPTKLGGLEGVKISLANLTEIFQHSMTMGELVSSSFSFQGVAHVNRTISALLDIKAFSKFRSHEFQLYTIDPKTKKPTKPLQLVCLGDEALRRSKFIDRCFEIRHDSVHNTGTRFRVTSNLISQIEDAMWYFDLMFSWFARIKFKELAASKK